MGGVTRNHHKRPLDRGRPFARRRHRIFRQNIAFQSRPRGGRCDILSGDEAFRGRFRRLGLEEVESIFPGGQT
jgi:hypothetical protein